MISKFNLWINENEKIPVKPPIYKIGDKVLLEWKEYSVLHYGKYKKAYARQGGLGKIIKIEPKSGKWRYELELITGAFNISDRIRRELYYNNVSFLSFQSEITTNNIEKFMQLYNKAIFSKGDKIVYKNVSQRIIGIATIPTIETEKIHYLLSDNWEPVEESQLESDEESSLEKIEIVIEEIAKKIKLTYKTEEKRYVFNAKVLNLKDSIAGEIYFRTDEDRDKFIKEIREFIMSKLDSDLQSCLNQGKPAVIEVKTAGTYSTVFIKKENVFEAARNLKINLKELFDKMRGKITGKKFGI